MLCPLCQSDNPAQAQRCRACGAALQSQRDQNGATPDALPNGSVLASAYAVENVLGQGGFGITYRCHDRMLDRSVAVKEFFPSGCRRQNSEVAPSRALSDANFREARAQFLSEARTLARCHHVGIVGVYAAFEANSTAYMVMELLHGVTLAQLLNARGGRMNEAEAVGIIERVGEALGFVHEQNLLHRDIKPDNIIVCDDGRVMLIDFGTARETVQGAVQGQTVEVTPGYAPLEQYAKQAKRGAFTDIYSLAATLYHLLTGQMPPAASDRALGVQLRNVREINPKVSASVAHATQSALQMEIAKRPQSVRAFLDLLHAPVEAVKVVFSPQFADLPTDENGETSDDIPAALAQLRARQQALRPGSVPSDDIPAALAQWRARQQALQPTISTGNPQPVKLAPPSAFSGASTPPDASTLSHLGSGGLSVQNPGASKKESYWGFGILVGVVGLLFFLSMADNRSKSTSSAYPDAEAIVASSDSNSHQDNLKRQQAQRAWDALPVALPTSTETLPAGQAPNLPDAPDAIDGIQPWNNRAEFSPDGTRLATIDATQTLRVLSLPERRPIRSIALDKNYVATDAIFSADNQTIAAMQRKSSIADSSNSIRMDVWSVRNGKRLGTFKINSNEDAVWPQAILSDERVLMRTYVRDTERSKLFLWNPKTGERSQSPIPLLEDTDWVYGVASPDDKEFALGNGAGRLQWLDMETGKRKNLFTSKLTGASYNNRFDAWNKNENEINVGAPLMVNFIDYSTNGAYLASRDSAEINVFDSKARNLASLTIDGFKETIMAISPDGNWLAARGALPYSPVGNLLWNVKTGQKIRLQSPSGKLLDFGFSPDGKQLYGVFARDKKFQTVTWPTDAEPVATFAKIGEKTIEIDDSISDDANSSTVANGAVAVPLQNSVGFYRQSNGEFIRTLGGGASPATALKFSPDGKFLLIRKNNGALQLWRMGAGDTSARWQSGGINEYQNAAIKAFYRTSRNLAFSSDNSLFACARFTGSSSVVELWNLQNAQSKPSLLARIAQPELVTALAFSPDDKALICGGNDGILQRINVATRQIQANSQTGETVADIAFTGEKMIVVGGSTTRFYEWPAPSETELSPLAKREIPLRYMNCWAISPDSELLAMAPKSGGDLQIWQLNTGSKLQSLSTNSQQQALGSLTFSADGTRLTSLQARSYSQLALRTWQRAKTP